MVQKTFIITPWINQKVVVPLASSKPKTNALNEVVKFISLQPCQPLPQLDTTHHWEENPYLELFPWKGERTVEHPSVLWLFRGLPTEVVSVSPDSEHWWGIEYPWMPGGSREQERVQQLWQHQRTCNTAERNWHSSLQLGEGAQPVAPRCIKHSSFVEGCLGNWLMSQVTQSTDRHGTLWVPGGHREQTRTQWLSAVPKNLQCHGRTQEGSRDNKVLKKKLANLSHWKNTCTSPENTHFQKIFERLPKSLVWLTDEVLSLYDANL